MTRLSVNINKIALIRNSRGRNFPDVREFSARCLDYGAAGITLHPRPDQRHARYSDVRELRALCTECAAELNVEGYPTPEFLEVVLEVRPDQCTLVPDAPGQITSDHGWRIRENAVFLSEVVGKLKDRGIRVSLFLDHDSPEIEAARALGADRIELYTEPYALAHESGSFDAVLKAFGLAAAKARSAGLGVNAGHDLSLKNLADFLATPDILEVSIGHALIVESLEFGLETVIRRYLAEIRRAAGT